MSARLKVSLAAFVVLFSTAVTAISAPDDANTNSDRVKRAKDLYKEAAKYEKGCSAFVSKVLQSDWQDANTLMGDKPTYVGVDNKYKGLTPGDVVGWRTEGGHGHVAIYVGEADMMFLDVKDENEKPRPMIGYGKKPLYKSSKY